MTRLSERQYQLHISVTMTIYVAAMLLVWPLTRTTPELWLKAALACIPVMPMLYAIALMARKVAGSDEMEQRAHLVALGVATGVVGALSLVGGMLAAAGAVKLDGSILVWVFPVTMITYGSSHWWVLTRRYGGSTGTCRSMSSFLLLMTGLMGLIALVSWWQGRLDPTRLGMLAGMSVSLLVICLIVGVRTLWRRRHGGSGADAEADEDLP